MQRELSDDIGTALIHRAQRGDDGAALAAEVVALWRAVDAALAPVLGKRGLSTVYLRALALTAGQRPWLGGVLKHSPDAMDLDALHAACAAEPAMAVAEAGRDLFRAFYDLLGSLIGPSLTTQLLSTVRGALAPDAGRTPGNEF